MHDILVFLTRWSPHIWLFGSVFGILMSGTLLFRVNEQRIALKHYVGSQSETSKFWFRHGLWFFSMHAGFLFVGLVTVMGVDSEWSQLFTLITLLAIPLILVYRSYDCLRLDQRLRKNGVDKQNGP